MSLTILRAQPERLAPLIDILCAASSADGHIATQETDVVRGALRMMLELDALPEDIESYIGTFDPAAFDLASAVDQLALDSDEDKQAVLAAVLDVATADRFVDSGEYGFVGELADMLGQPMPTRLR